MWVQFPSASPFIYPGKEKGVATQVLCVTLEDLQKVWNDWSNHPFQAGRKFKPFILTLDTRPFTEFKLSGLNQVELLIKIEDLLSEKGLTGEISGVASEPLFFGDPTTTWG